MPNSENNKISLLLTLINLDYFMLEYTLSDYDT